MYKSYYWVTKGCFRCEYARTKFRWFKPYATCSLLTDQIGIIPQGLCSNFKASEERTSRFKLSARTINKKIKLWFKLLKLGTNNENATSWQ